MPTVSALFIYPIKSCASVSMTELVYTSRGLENDRRFMVVDLDGKAITQRENPRLAHISPNVTAAGLRVDYEGKAATTFGFGRETRLALERRRLWLAQNGFAWNSGARFPAQLLEALERRDLAKASEALSAKLNLPYAPAKSGTRISGVFAERIDLVSGRFAVIANAREFTLVPWRPSIDKQLGRQVSGLFRGDEVSWTFGRQRGGPSP